MNRQVAYGRWMDSLYNVPANPYGLCESITAKMKEVFPELVRVRGHYICYIWGEREHWWLKDPVTGTIVDPTARQFPSVGLGTYREWVEGSPEPIGKCMNCGGYTYENDFAPLCSEKCSREYVAYLNDTSRRL